MSSPGPAIRPNTAAAPDAIYTFGTFHLDTVRRELLQGGQPVAITAKVFDTLLVLVRHAGRVVPKEELLRQVWPDSFVEERNLTQNVFVLRRLLGDRQSPVRTIVTVPGRGYLFAAAVTVGVPGPTVMAPPPVPQQSPNRPWLVGLAVATLLLALLAVVLLWGGAHL